MVGRRALTLFDCVLHLYRTFDIVIALPEVLVGLVFWIAYSYPTWLTLLIEVEALVLLVGTMAVAWKVWAEMGNEGGPVEIADHQEDEILKDA
ncbi:Fc.00g056310.m01.CDS01 [Cosmosporella sp. VM-42]